MPLLTTNGRPPPPLLKSVVQQPPDGTFWGDYILRVSSVADDIPAWGTLSAQRDLKLREFWPTEPIFAGSLFTTIARYVAFGFELQGPQRMVDMTNKMLHNIEFGGGWESWLTKILTDMFTCDNAAFSELVRESDDPRAPVISLKHLDSNRCVRTGRADEPITYWDIQGRGHKMKWYQVCEFTEMPSPVEVARGMQVCALSRILRAAQIAKDISVYKREKISGRFTRAIHLVSGVQMATITDAMKGREFQDDSAGLTRYSVPIILASLDPTKQVSVATIELAGLPDGFDEEEFFKQYIATMALGFGADYQDFAPLPGGNLGSAQQSETLHLKSRGKGPRLFMTMMENKFNYHGILPQTVKMKFGDQDIAEDMQHARLRLLHAQTRAVQIKSRELTPEIARQIATDIGDLDPRYLAALGETDVAPNVPVTEIFDHSETLPEDQPQVQTSNTSTSGH